MCPECERDGVQEPCWRPPTGGRGRRSKNFRARTRQSVGPEVCYRDSGFRQVATEGDRQSAPTFRDRARQRAKKGTDEERRNVRDRLSRGGRSDPMACHVQLVATNKWVAAVVALVIGTAFLLNGVASMRRTSRIGYPLWKWLGLED